VDILFQDRKLEKAFDDQSLLIRKYGLVRAKLLVHRFDELKDAENLAVMRLLSQARCHELRQNRQGTLSVDLGHPYRLIFEPANDPIPKKSDGGLNWIEVTIIRILAVEDYHD
jgi:plasmid maintenance system killer protein